MCMCYQLGQITSKTCLSSTLCASCGMRDMMVTIGIFGATVKSTAVAVEIKPPILVNRCCASTRKGGRELGVDM